MIEPLQSWVEIPANSQFSLYNLPYGIFQTLERSARVGVAIGDYVLDLQAMAALGFLDGLGINRSVYAQPYLNELIATGSMQWLTLRKRLIQLLSYKNQELKPYAGQVLVHQEKATMKLPIKVGDYTDFYSSFEHATNVGKMFRDPEKALLPNWKHLPVAYHGRSSSIVVSGTSIHRPHGQLKPVFGSTPVFRPSERLDFELEMAFVVGRSSALGRSVSTGEAQDYIFGLALINDWSARDIQKWEYQPLGPFLGKNFATSMAPWVIPLTALEPFRIAGPAQDPPVLPYLSYSGDWHFDIPLEARLRTKEGSETIICKTNYKYLYWNMLQQLAHHTVNGCNVNIGDLMASGTISGTRQDSFGSMLELSWNGTKPIALVNGHQRSFLEDYDTVILSGCAGKGDISVGFGEVTGQVSPALD